MDEVLLRFNASLSPEYKSHSWGILCSNEKYPEHFTTNSAISVNKNIDKDILKIYQGLSYFDSENGQYVYMKFDSN